VKESARANTGWSSSRSSILLFFIVVGLLSFDSGNLEPFAPAGIGGIESAAAIIFFAYIGFDAVSTTGEEAKKPARDLPIAIIGSLAIATVLYILVALTAVGLASQQELAGSDAPLTEALRTGSGIGSWAGDLLSLGALVAITSVVLTVMYGATRIIFTMARDGLFPRAFTKLNRRRVPARLTLGPGRLHRPHRGVRAAQRDRRARLHRDALRVPGGEPRRDPAAPHAADLPAASASRSCRCCRASARCCAST
jgi:APA family basic amino acid/polyamine antiporter